MVLMLKLPFVTTFPWGHLQNNRESEQQQKIAVQAVSILVFRKQRDRIKPKEKQFTKASKEKHAELQVSCSAWTNRNLEETCPYRQVSKLFILREVKLRTKLPLHPAPVLKELREAVTMQ